MKTTLAFDVYGTLVDPAGMAKHQDLGVEAANFAEGTNGDRSICPFRVNVLSVAESSACSGGSRGS
jgi:hypothetical protein